MKLYLWFCIDSFKLPVFLQKFCIFTMFFLMELFFSDSIAIFKIALPGSVAYFSVKDFSMKIWCNFRFVYYVCNLALIRKETFRFIYTTTIIFLVFYFPWLFLNYVCWWLVSGFSYSYNSFSHYSCWIFMVLGEWFCLKSIWGSATTSVNISFN